jgi:hypothetical protein
MFQPPTPHTPPGWVVTPAFSVGVWASFVGFERVLRPRWVRVPSLCRQPPIFALLSCFGSKHSWPKISRSSNRKKKKKLHKNQDSTEFHQAMQAIATSPNYTNLIGPIPQTLPISISLFRHPFRCVANLPQKRLKVTLEPSWVILRCDVGLVGIPWDYLLRMGLVLVLISITMIIITMIRINNVYKMK